MPTRSKHFYKPTKNLKGDKVGAFEDLKKSIELNPTGDEAMRLEGQHSNFDNLYKGGIF